MQSLLKSEKIMFGLCWDIKELEALNEKGRQLHVEVSTLHDKLSDDSFDMRQNNVPKTLSALKEMESIVKRVSRHKWIPATHALVFMISPEERYRKPCFIHSMLTNTRVYKTRQHEI